MIESGLHSRESFVKEIEGLRETEENYGVDDAERQHVACYHAVDHCYERSG